MTTAATTGTGTGAGPALVIVGAGGHGRETLDVVEASVLADPSCAPRFLGFVADGADEVLVRERGAVVLGPSGDLDAIVARLGADYHLAIGNGSTRARLDASVDPSRRDRAVTLIHPTATIGAANRIGEGVLLAAGARVTTNVQLGRHTHLNVNAVVSHDAVVGDYVTLSPGVLVNGSVVIEDRAFLGTGAIVLPGRRIGADAVIAAGAVVADDVPAGVTAKGVPARW
jgi:sugar O-acyltransferase (sialic acid O-acetyltransferase NeuD family)